MDATLKLVYLFVVTLCVSISLFILFCLTWRDISVRLKYFFANLFHKGIVRILRNDHRIDILLVDLKAKTFKCADASYVIDKAKIVIEKNLPTLYYATGNAEPIDFFSRATKGAIVNAEYLDELLEEIFSAGFMAGTKQGAKEKLMFLLYIGAVCSMATLYLVLKLSGH